MKIELRAGETELGKWTLFYIPPGGGKYNGNLVVTNQRLLYDAKFDVSAKGLLEEAVFIKWGSEGELEIEKSGIQQVDVEKKLLSKRAILTMTDGSKHIFDYGALNVDKCAEAIQAR